MGEPYDYWEESVVPLEQPTPCEECGRALARGDRALVAKYAHTEDALGYERWDGDPPPEEVGTYVSCLHCRVIIDWLVEQCDAFPLSSALDEAWEHVGDLDLELPFWERLTLGRAVKHAWQQWFDWNGKLRPLPVITMFSPDRRERP